MGKFTKRFTEDEERAILSIYFTNPFGDISFIWPNKDFGPEEIAANNSAYSRSHLPYQQRFLKQIEKEPSLDMNYINTIAKDPSIINKTGLVGDVTKAAAHKFHTRWSLGWTEEEKDTAIRGYGDGSIKDGAIAYYHVENITDLDGKNITQNPKANPQVKSTRYLDWKSSGLSPDAFGSADERPSIDKLIRFIEGNPDIKGSRFAEKIVVENIKLFRFYEEATDKTSSYMKNNSVNREFLKYFLSDEAIKPDIEKWIEIIRRTDKKFNPSSSDINRKIRDIKKKRKDGFSLYARKTVFDSTRYLLTSAIPTSLANSEDVNSFGLAVTNLLSSPMLTAQSVGIRLLEEGSKVMPTLLGAKTHIKKNEFMINLRNTLTEFAKERFEFEREKNYEAGARVKDLTSKIPMFTDLQLAVNMMVPYTYGSPKQIKEHFKKNPEDIRSLVNIVNSLRGKFDPLPSELLHGGLMKETLIDIGADRDLQRHRRGFHTSQLISTYLGYETPPLFELAGLKNKFDKLMQENDAAFRKVAEDRYTAQLMVPFAYRRRRIYTFGFGQDGFVIELRSKEGSHWSYADAVRDMHVIDKRKMPLFSELVRFNTKTYPHDLINLKQAKQWYDKNKRR